MRKSSLAWILPVLFCCCNKQDSSDGIKPEVFDFNVRFDSVYTAYPNNNITIPFTVNVLSGDIITNPVTFSITGLPASVVITPPAQTVTGIMGGAFTLTLGNTAPGTDTGSFTYTSAVHGTETHKLIIRVLQPPDYAPKLAGTYPHSYDFCQPDSFFSYTSVVTTVPDTPYVIYISNIKKLGSGLKARAIVSDVMGTNKVTIPAQNLGPYVIWGSGTFFHDVAPNDTLFQMAINDTLVQGLDTQYCTIHIQH